MSDLDEFALLEEVTLYRFRVRTADGRETFSKILLAREQPNAVLAPGEEKEKSLANPRWSNDSFEHGDHATMVVDAPGLDGHTVRFVVERKHGADWDAYQTVEGKVENGVAEATLKLEHPTPEEQADPAHLRFSCEVV